MLTQAYILIVNESGTNDSVISNLRNFSSIVDAFGTFGTYDVLTKFESPDEQIIYNDISNDIRKITHIRSTLILLVDRSTRILKTTDVEEIMLNNHTSQAFVGIRCFKSLESNNVEILGNIHGIVSIDILIGSYEIFCIVVDSTYNDISDIVDKKI